jgi:hypothetical protein
VRAGDPKWCGGFPPPLRLSDRSEGDVGEENRSQRTSSCVPPAPLHLLYTRSATGAHNHQLVGAPDQGARSNRVGVDEPEGADTGHGGHAGDVVGLEAARTRDEDPADSDGPSTMERGVAHSMEVTAQAGGVGGVI